MEQLSFFSESGQTPGLPSDLLQYIPDFFTESESQVYLAQLISGTPWRQKVVSMYDKHVVTPRLSAWYADPEIYDYTSLRKSSPNCWTPELLHIRNKVEAFTGIKFNSVLLNYYRDAHDSVAWHSDNEETLGTHPVIASLSLGQVRGFDIRNKQNHKQKYTVKLENGSLLLMKGNLQQHWDHRIAKSTKRMKERLNLTFRIVQGNK